MATPERLQKFVAHAGAASRRGAEDLVRAGRVTVNGRPCLDPAAAVGPGDDVRLDGRSLRLRRPLTFMINKPVGYVATVRDPQGRPTVLQLLPAAAGRRLYPVGRLDVGSEGLLLLSDDGALCHALTHPRHQVAKTYRVAVDRPPTSRELAALRTGMPLADGPTRPAEVLVEAGEAPAAGVWLRFVLREGRNRQVRRMCAAVGLSVRRLIRVAVDGLALGDLPQGAWRRLEDGEVAALRRAGGLTPSPGTASAGEAESASVGALEAAEADRPGRRGGTEAAAEAAPADRAAAVGADGAEVPAAPDRVAGPNRPRWAKGTQPGRKTGVADGPAGTDGRGGSGTAGG